MGWDYVSRPDHTFLTWQIEIIFLGLVVSRYQP